MKSDGASLPSSLFLRLKELRDWRWWCRHLPHVLGFVLMLAAVFVVQHELRHLRVQDIKQAVRTMPLAQVLAAALCTFLSYGVLFFYDKLAVIQVGYPQISFRKTAFASFCSYVLSHNLGFSAVSGAAVRYRLYRNWGVDPLAITQIIAFCSVTYLLGALSLIGGVFIIDPSAISHLKTHISVSETFLRSIGVVFWLFVAGYVGLAFRVREFRFCKWVIVLPSVNMAMMQIIVATLEVAATASIAFVLLPSQAGIGFGLFLAIYLMSYTAGLISSVPGGLGVFDGTMLLGLSPYMPIAQILSMILVFRLFYYIIPLFIAGGMFVGHELFLRGDAVWVKKKNLAQTVSSSPLSGTLSGVYQRSSLVIRQSEASFSVAVATAVVSLCGMLLICLVLLDPTPSAVKVPHDLVHLLQICGNYLLSLMGVALVGLAIGLAHRVTLAWHTALGLLLFSAVLTFLRGNTIFVPGILGLSALFIVPYRQCYYRRAHVLNESLTFSTVLCLLLFFGCVVILSLCHTPLESWWQIVFSDQVSGLVRVTVALSVLLALLAVIRLIMPGRVVLFPWTEHAKTRYCTLADGTPDISYFSPEGFVVGDADKAMLPLHINRGCFVGLGDPVGEREDSISAIWHLRDLAVQEGLKLVFWNVSDRFLSIYGDIGLSVWPLEEKNNRYFCYPSADVSLAFNFAKTYAHIVKTS